MATAKQLTENVCFESGHDIVALPVKEFFDPATKSKVITYIHLCRKCGFDIETIRGYRGTVNRTRGTTREERNKNAGTQGNS